MIKIYKIEKVEKKYSGKNGEVVEIINKKGTVIKTENGGIILLEVKFQGKKIQTGMDILNGRKMSIGERLE